MVASVFSQTTVNSNYPSAQVVAASNPPMEVLLFNADPQNTIWLSDNNAVQAGDVNNATPLPPLSSVTFNGAEDIYAGCIVAQTAKLNIYPSGSSYFQGQSIQPIANFPNPASLPGGGIINPGPLNAVTLVSFADVSGFTSYDVSSYSFAVNPLNAQTPICLAFEFSWFDDLTTMIPVYQENWWTMVGSNTATPPFAPYGNPIAFGSGPNHGRYLTVKAWASTFATVQKIQLEFFNLFGSFRTAGKSDWRQNCVATSPPFGGFVVVNGGDNGCGVDSIIANQVSTTIPANMSWIIPFNLYNGSVFYRFALNGAAAASDPVIIHCDNLLSSQLVFVSNCPNTIVNLQNVANTEQEGTVILPRAPCALLIQGNAAGTTNFILSVTAAQ